MKRTVLGIIIIVVIGIAFYFGYQKSQHKITRETHPESQTVTVNKSIKLEYQQNPTTSSGLELSHNDVTIDIKGTLNLEDLINNLFLNDKTITWDSYNLEINPEVGKRRYQINLSYPTQDSALNIVEHLGKELGFTTLVSETTMPFYRARRNDKPIAFIVSKQLDSSNNSFSSDSIYKFKNYRFDGIFRQYKSYGIFIEDKTGVTEKFNGEVILDKNNPEAMKAELQMKAGIDLIPFEKTIKFIKIY
ncbi:MAG: hypothetical protein ACE14V_04675 [bacterium]